MTKIKDLQERLKWITNRIILIVNSKGKFNTKRTELINARFTYINSIADYKILLSFRTKLDGGGYDYTKVNINGATTDIELLDNSIEVLVKIKEYLIDNETDINELGQDIKQLNKHISEIVGSNISLADGKYFRYCTLSLGYNKDENCIAVKITEKVKNKPIKHFIKFLEKNGEIKLLSSEVNKDTILNLGQVKTLIAYAIA